MLARAVAAGLIGKPRFITLVQYVPLVASPEAKMPRWWFDADAGGGWLGASGSHVIDQIRWTLGEFSSVSAALPIVSAREGVAEDSYVLRFRLTNAAEGILQQTGGAWGPLARVTRVAGTLGTAWIENGIVKVADSQGTRDLPIPEDLVLPPPPPPSDDPRQRYTAVELGPYTRLFEAMRNAMEGTPEKTAVAPATFADGVACMEVLDAIRQSAASNGALVTLR